MHAMVLTGHGGLDKYKWFETWKPPKPQEDDCLLYTSPSPRDYAASRMPASA